MLTEMVQTFAIQGVLTFGAPNCCATEFYLGASQAGLLSTPSVTKFNRFGHFGRVCLCANLYEWRLFVFASEQFAG